MTVLFADKISQLHYSSVMQLHNESNLLICRERYYRYAIHEALLEAEQDLWAYLSDFLRDKENRYVVIVTDVCYICALRLELYADGVLISGLETNPLYRRQGYAGKLLDAVAEHCRGRGLRYIYSHIAMSNDASLALHKNHGFILYSNAASLIDGSVRSDMVTLRKIL